MYAVLRDASGYRTHHYHQGVEGASWMLIPKYHIPVNDRMTETACGRMAAEFTATSIDSIPESRRCQRPGCKQRWPIGQGAR
jgi:hypothetical protein